MLFMLKRNIIQIFTFLTIGAMFGKGYTSDMSKKTMRAVWIKQKRLREMGGIYAVRTF